MILRILVLLCISLNVQSQWVKSNSFSQASEGLPYHQKMASLFSSASNIAGIQSLKSFSVAIAYDQLISLPELSTRKLFLAAPVKKAAWLLQLQQSGFENYRESDFRFGYAKDLGKLALAGSFSYGLVNIPGYQNLTTPGFTIASVFKMSESVNYGLQITNYSSGDNKATATELIAGISVSLSEQIIFGGEVQHIKGYGNFFRMLLEYYPQQKLMFRIGVMQQGLFTAGGLRYGEFTIELNVQMVPHLGPQAGIRLQYHKGKE